MEELKKRLEEIGDYLDISGLDEEGQMAVISFYNFLLEKSMQEVKN